METPKQLSKTSLFLWLIYGVSISLFVVHLTKLLIYGYLHYGLRHNFHLIHFKWYLLAFTTFILTLIIYVFLRRFNSFEYSKTQIKHPSLSVISGMIIFSLIVSFGLEPLHEFDLSNILNDNTLQPYLSNLDFSLIFYYMKFYFKLLNWTVFLLIFIFLIYKSNQTKTP